MRPAEKLDWPSDYEGSMAHAVALGLMTASGGATNRCQCTECGEVFSTDANFNRHRRNGNCIDPTEAGLVQSEGGWWHEPGPQTPILRSA